VKQRDKPTQTNKEQDREHTLREAQRGELLFLFISFFQKAKRYKNLMFGRIFSALHLLQQPQLIRLAKFDGPDDVQGDGGELVLRRGEFSSSLEYRVEERFPPRSNFSNDWVTLQLMMEVGIHFQQSDLPSGRGEQEKSRTWPS
jgi:hypothetical protein